MKSKLKKIQAFTLSEILIAMAIASIVVGIGGTVLNLFTKNIHLIQNNYSNTTTMSLLEQQLTVDFNRYNEIAYDNATQKMFLKNTLDSVSYTINENYISRVEDTLLTKKSNALFYYMGLEVVEGKIDAIKISLDEKNEAYVFCYKENDASQMMLNYGN